MMRAHAALVSLSLALALAACPRPEPVPNEAAEPFPPRPIPRGPAEEPPPGMAPVEVGPELAARYDLEVVVLPFTANDPRDAAAALALAELAALTLDADKAVWVSGLKALTPDALAKSHTRFVVGGRVRRERGAKKVEMWLMDREVQKTWTRSAPIDPPRLFAPRLVLADLFADGGLGPDELHRADMVWHEDLDETSLATAGRLVAARLGLPDPSPDAASAGTTNRDAALALAKAARARAPYSYLLGVLETSLRFGFAQRCSAPLIAALSDLFAVHRETPPELEMLEMDCALAQDLDPELPRFPAWSKRSDAGCRIGGKSLTAIAAGRGPVSGAVDLGPGFVTGLGGVYRGDTCDAGLAVERGARDLGPPLVKASIELEAAFYFYAMRNSSKSRMWFERAKETVAAAPDKHCLLELLAAEAMLGLGDLAVEAGNADEAREALEDAKATAERCQEVRMLGRALNSEALLEQGRSRFDASLRLLEEARVRFASVGDAMNLAVVTTNLGVTWLHLGRFDKAMPALEAALAEKKRLGSRGGVGVLLENLGVAELARGRGDKAEAYLNEALEVASDAHTRSILYVQLARLELSRGRIEAATRHMDAARDEAKTVHARVLEAVIEQVDASVADQSGKFEKALSDFNSALQIRRELGDRAGEGVTLSLLMAVAARMEKPALAIMYGKLAIAAHQEVRFAARAIDRDTASEFTKGRAETYRKLAELLVGQGRLIEAERVMALLKEDELVQWTRDASAAATNAVPLSAAEKGLESRYNEVAGEVMAAGRAYTELAAKWPRNPDEDKQLEALSAKLEKANARFGTFLASLTRETDALEKSARTVESLRDGVGIGADLADLGKGVVAVYTLVAKGAVHLIVVSPGATVARTVKIEERQLGGLVMALRAVLQDPRRDARPVARELYEVLIDPIERDLVGAGAKTILWSLDRALRYVPMGALYDGKRWAVERWAHAVFTPASNARLKDKPQDVWRALALGVSEAHPPFVALPAVKEEIAMVVRDEAARGGGVLPGFAALDAGFTREVLLKQLTRRWPVVHIASHFSFTPGDKDASYLLLGDGSKFSVSDLERLPNLFAGVDLLALSACNTATGEDAAADGSEVESFAVLAQRKGARAVIASLWPVSDSSTSALMRRFYQLDKSAGSKLEGLRQAQLELLSGKLVPQPGAVRARPLTTEGADDTSAKVPPDWRHPFYWAPFVLVGNTL